MAHKKIFEGEEKEFVEQALKSGTISRNEIVHLAVLARLLGKSVAEVASVRMDCIGGVQQVFQEMAGEKEKT